MLLHKVIILCYLLALSQSYLREKTPQRIYLIFIFIAPFRRCIIISLPHRPLNKTAFLLALPAYSLLLVIHDVLVGLLGDGVKLIYGPNSVSCYLTFTRGSPDVWYYIDVIFDLLQVGLPPIICCTSFCICAVKLASSSAPTESGKKRNRRAAVTVTMFTGLFLVCNLPYFLNRIFHTVTVAFFELPGPIFSNKYMGWYSFLVSKILFTGLNATLNPALYYYRIPGLKEWLQNRCRRVNERVSNANLSLGMSVMTPAPAGSPTIAAVYRNNGFGNKPAK